MNAIDFHADALVQPAAITRPMNGDRSASGAFSSALGTASSDATPTEYQAREAATQFVATAFIMPVLAMMHDSPFATEPFAPNAAQKRFMPLLDWEIADRVTASANFPLVDRLVEQMTQPAAAPREQGGVDVRG